MDANKIVIEAADIVDSLQRSYPEFTDEDDVALILVDAASLLKKGWTRTEVIRLLRNVENVDPNVDEDVALANMSRIRKAVELRLAFNV